MLKRCWSNVSANSNLFQYAFNSFQHVSTLLKRLFKRSQHFIEQMLGKCWSKCWNRLNGNWLRFNSVKNRIFPYLWRTTLTNTLSAFFDFSTIFGTDEGFFLVSVNAFSKRTGVDLRSVSDQSKLDRSKCQWPLNYYFSYSNLSDVITERWLVISYYTDRMPVNRQIIADLSLNGEITRLQLTGVYKHVTEEATCNWKWKEAVSVALEKQFVNHDCRNNSKRLKRNCIGWENRFSIANSLSEGRCFCFHIPRLCQGEIEENINFYEFQNIY